MPMPDMTPDAIKAVITSLLDQPAETYPPTLERFAALQGQRAARLAGAAARLQAHLGQDHPRVTALRRTAAAADFLSHSLGTTATRAMNIPKLAPQEWMVFGRVLTVTGAPVPGVQVHVFDLNGLFHGRENLDDLLGEKTTDVHGDFVIIYHQRDFAEPGEKTPDLYVVVSDTHGKELYSSRDHVYTNAGRAEYFEIVLNTVLQTL
jgi:hypothetical protein